VGPADHAGTGTAYEAPNYHPRRPAISSIIYKTLKSSPIPVVGGEGVWLHGANGERILDSCGGVAVSTLGHRHPRMRAVMAREADRVTWAHAGSFTCAAAEELGTFLTERSRGLTRCQFLSGGSEAMELSLKVAYQYHWERGEPDRQIFIARRQSYHGSTLGMLAVSGNRDRRSIFEPLLMKAAFVSPCYAYRGKLAGESDFAYAKRLALELDSTIAELGPGRVAGFILEPVVGSTNGAVPAVPGYLEAIKAVCDRHGVLLIIDDVMSGMGRTGHLFSFHEDGIAPDIVAIGKGLAAGYQPISAMLVADHVYAALERGTGVLRNGQTHVNHPYACAVALEAQHIIEEDGLLAAVQARGIQMRASLQRRLAEFEYFGEVRGRGTFLGVEFVADRATQEPLRGGGAWVAELKRQALARGLLIYPGSGTVDGEAGNHVMFAPAFIATEEDIELMVSRFVDVVFACRAVFAAAGRSTAGAAQPGLPVLHTHRSPS
jgi:adenosylmethionine-8-amino-7-oxononanoate aminotransferase